MAMSCWFRDPLVQDIHDYLRVKESKLPIYHSQSPQLNSRRYLVDWLAIVAEKFDLCACSKHLAISLLDYFMDQYSITESQLKLVVLGCLLIACKMEEQEINIPKSTTLNQLVPAPGYSARDYLHMELMLLQAFSWRLDLPTAAHFISYFLCCAVTASDIHHERPLRSKCHTAKDYVQRYCTYFLEVSLQDHYYRSFAPSLVAASCIMSSRICLGISPAWTPQLRDITRYSYIELQHAVGTMLRTHKLDSQESSPAGTRCSTPSDTSSPDEHVSSPCSTDHGYDSLAHSPDTCSSSPDTCSSSPEPDCFITDVSGLPAEAKPVVDISSQSASMSCGTSGICAVSNMCSTNSNDTGIGLSHGDVTGHAFGQPSSSTEKAQGHHVITIY